MKKWIYSIGMIVLGIFFPGVFVYAQEEIRIGVIDTGFFYEETDHHWYVSQKGCTLVHAACVLGLDVAEGDAYPFVTSQEHGYRMVRTVIETLKQYSLAKEIRIIPVRIESPATKDALVHMYDALQFLRMHDVDIISISYGGNTYSKEVQELLHTLVQEHIIVLAASGNIPERLGLFPARYDGVIGVGAWDAATKQLYAARTATDVVVPAVLIPTIPIGASTATATLAAYTALLRQRNIDESFHVMFKKYLKKDPQFASLYQRTGTLQSSIREWNVVETTVQSFSSPRRLSSLEEWLRSIKERGWFVFSSQR